MIVTLTYGDPRQEPDTWQHTSGEGEDYDAALGAARRNLPPDAKELVIRTDRDYHEVNLPQPRYS
ncbi:MAG: hypothetical protein ABF811_08065 [Pseudoclavibacter sp.]